MTGLVRRLPNCQEGRGRDVRVKSSASMKRVELEDRLLSVYVQRVTREWKRLGAGLMARDGRNPQIIHAILNDCIVRWFG